MKAEYIIIGNLEGFTVIGGEFGGAEIFDKALKDDKSALMSVDESIEYLKKKLFKDIRVFQEKDNIDTYRVEGKFKAYFKDDAGNGDSPHEAIGDLIET